MTVKSNRKRQSDYNRRRIEAGFILYREWVTEEQKLILESVLQRMRDNEDNDLPALHNLI